MNRDRNGVESSNTRLSKTYPGTISYHMPKEKSLIHSKEIHKKILSRLRLFRDHQFSFALLNLLLIIGAGDRRIILF